MAARTGQILTMPSLLSGAQDGYAEPKLAALAGSGINPIPHYSLAAYDTNSIRYFWVDTAVALTNAPTPAGGATYISATLVILGRF